MRCLSCVGALRGRFSRAATFALFVLSVPFASLPAQGQMQEIRHDDSWYYRGEVERKQPDVEACVDIPCERVCDGVYCAHGTGEYGTDGGELYTGGFRHGFMDGFGEYSSDFAHYVGGFANGAFDGEGILDCLGAPTFKGRFAAGFMDGPFEVSGRRVEVFSHVPVGPIFPRDLGYKRGLDYASTPCPE